MLKPKELLMPLKSLWSQQSERWKNVGSPTRPSQEDEQIFSDLILSYLDLHLNTQKQVMVAGVTPELINNILWPSNVNLHAFDASAGMIQQNWSPPATLSAQVTQSDWRNLPLENSSIDLIIGDGIFTALGGDEKMIEVLKEFKRVLKKDGKIVFRNFIRPEKTEKTEKVVSDAKNGRITNFGSLKWRLAMSLIDENISIVQPKKIHETFVYYFVDRDALSQISGWSLEQIATIDSYKEMEALFYFPTIEALSTTFKQFFHIDETRQGSYELAECCPFISLKHQE